MENPWQDHATVGREADDPQVSSPVIKSPPREGERPREPRLCWNAEESGLARMLALPEADFERAVRPLELIIRLRGHVRNLLQYALEVRPRP